MAETDVKRNENFSEELKDIEDCLDFLKDVKLLPDEFFSMNYEIQSKAFDLMTATLELIMRQVTYLLMSSGGLEFYQFTLTALARLFKQLTTRNQKIYESARESLKTAVREYDRALDHGHRKMDAEHLSITKSKNSFKV